MVGLIEKINGPYIQKEYYKNIQNYQYRGGDNSIFYTLCMAPFCNWAVEYFPTWVA